MVQNLAGVLACGNSTPRKLVTEEDIGAGQQDNSTRRVSISIKRSVMMRLTQPLVLSMTAALVDRDNVQGGGMPEDPQGGPEKAKNSKGWACVSSKPLRSHVRITALHFIVLKSSDGNAKASSIFAAEESSTDELQPNFVSEHPELLHVRSSSTSSFS